MFTLWWVSNFGHWCAVSAVISREYSERTGRSWGSCRRNSLGSQKNKRRSWWKSTRGSRREVCPRRWTSRWRRSFFFQLNVSCLFVPTAVRQMWCSHIHQLHLQRSYFAVCHLDVFLLQQHPRDDNSRGGREWAGPGHGWDGDRGRSVPVSAQRGIYQHCCHFLSAPFFSWSQYIDPESKQWKDLRENFVTLLYIRDFLYYGTGLLYRLFITVSLFFNQPAWMPRKKTS